MSVEPLLRSSTFRPFTAIGAVAAPSPHRPRLAPGVFALALLAALVLLVSACGTVADENGEVGPDAGVGSPPALDADIDAEPDANDSSSCDTGYAGPDCDECAAGYQDLNDDGVCKPACDATGDLALECGFGACEVDADGDRVCLCDAGYELGEQGCEL
jgi:hypothetical protein